MDENGILFWNYSIETLNVQNFADMESILPIFEFICFPIFIVVSLSVNTRK